jgi:hypothetical protein
MTQADLVLDGDGRPEFEGQADVDDAALTDTQTRPKVAITTDPQVAPDGSPRADICPGAAQELTSDAPSALARNSGQESLHEQTFGMDVAKFVLRAAHELRTEAVHRDVHR